MIPQKEYSPPSIQTVIDLAIDYNPMLATRDISTVYCWLNEGCDIDQDIMPTLKQIMGRKLGVSTFKYFSNAVREAKDKRLIRAKTEAEQRSRPPEHYMKIYAWKRDRGMTLTTSQEEELRAYEAIHGAVV